MALPGSGPISSSMIQTEFGGSNPIAISEYYQTVSTFSFSQNLYSDAGLTTLASANWYSNGFSTSE